MRLVLDTNVWLDWLVFDDPSLRELKFAVAEGRVKLFIDPPCHEELVRVLARPLGKRRIEPRDQEVYAGACLGLASLIATELPSGKRTVLPRCSDPDDQKFLELALAARADVLLTKDQALLDLARRKGRPVPFRIVRPHELPVP